ncbi:MarR family transcriptional regulator [Acinetobacter sp. ANC 4558]|uniref:MarR family winged helix-turn-helix transcriptional regulator n=1 Tax=Acinetobacter sp. ANC 4558 TaxID=1977876 RepID=UPI000B6F2FAC|nr:MarR family transcriptional regulator [Acinetobacter sp. ANC 4558]OTG87123.1 MarR family transcriptional regulator [Acinetobacter sp. ANC 4558]
MSDEINTLLVPYKLNYSLWQVLFVIEDRHGCTSIEIADYLNVSKPSIAKRIHSLMLLNVLQQVETDDKRQKKLILSPTGRELFKQCSHVVDEFESRLIQTLDSEQVKQSTTLLQQLTDQLEKSRRGDLHE